MTKAKTTDPSKMESLLKLVNLRKHKNMLAEMVTTVENADAHDKDGIFEECGFDLHLAIVHLKMVNDVLTIKTNKMQYELGVHEMTMPDGWTADDWSGILRLLCDYKRSNADAEARRRFVIAEHARLGNIVNIVGEYHITIPLLFRWIDGCDVESGVTPKMIRDDDMAAMKRLDKAFKEAKK